MKIERTEYYRVDYGTTQARVNGELVDVPTTYSGPATGEIAALRAENERLKADRERHTNLIFQMYWAAGGPSRSGTGDELEAIKRLAEENKQLREDLQGKTVSPDCQEK
jgi:hypothetical protein